MVKAIVGMMGSSVLNGAKAMASPAQVNAFLDVVAKCGITELDTARIYNGGKSEELLGDVGACKRFEVSTKAPGWCAGTLGYDNILTANEESMKALQTDKVDIYYLHGPDRTVPIEGACKAINEAYKRGTFKRFGVSNLTDDEVQQIYDICKKNGYVMPSVYQGGYSPLHRNAEKTLFPLLRRLNMNFYAFSPFAGGLLAKPIDQSINPEAESRYAKMPIFGEMFLKKEMLSGLQNLNKLCQQENTTIRDATVAWCKYHSPLTDGDGVIWGASSVEQIESTLKTWQHTPKLSPTLADAFESLWKSIESVAPSYHS